MLPKAKGLYRHQRKQGYVIRLNGCSRESRTQIYIGSTITPVTDILHELAKHKSMGVKTVRVKTKLQAVVCCRGSFAGRGSYYHFRTGCCVAGEAIELGVSVKCRW